MVMDLLVVDGRSSVDGCAAVRGSCDPRHVDTAEVMVDGLDGCLSVDGLATAGGFAKNIGAERGLIAKRSIQDRMIANNAR